VASDLAAESETGLLRHFSASSEVTPWESRGIKETFGKIKGAVGKVLDKAKGKKP